MTRLATPSPRSRVESCGSATGSSIEEVTVNVAHHHLARSHEPGIGRLRALSVLLSVVVALGSCGGSTSDEVDAGATGFAVLDGVTGSLQSLAVTDAGGSVAVVSGVSDGVPRAELTWIANDDAEPVRTPVPGDTPLFNLSTWWTGQEVMVLGLLCPKWQDAEEEPLWSDQRQDNAAVACGSERFVLLGWTPTSGEWRTVDGLDLSSRNGVVVTGVRGRTALVVRRGEPAQWWVTVDSATGETRALPEPPDTGGSAEVQFAACVAGDGEPFAVLVWTVPVPEVVTTQGWPLDLVRPMDVPEGQEGGFLALSPAGESWQPVPLNGPVGDWNGSTPTCRPEGISGGLPGSGSIIDVAGDSASATRLPALVPPAPDGSAVRVDAAQGSGRLVATAQSGELPAENPDDPYAADAWLYAGGSWSSLEAADLGAGSYPFVAGQALYAMQIESVADNVFVKIVGP